ncbi:ComEC/Rec2 family competence protein [Flagellimonas sp.]|uniref:ComEC/Rec2 family competence protein n=1 Tax=Flagellimonas sp. TaxID=2058762 RepID=UPI003BAEC777
MTIRFLKAGNGDCISITYRDGKAKNRNIVIDGGRSATYFDTRFNRKGPLRKEIDRIRSNGEKIDLLVLSHIDNDHIEGFLSWFSKDKKASALVERVWFNSGKSIAKELKEKENKDLAFNVDLPGNTNTGVPEALEFEEYLTKGSIWDGKLIGAGSKLSLHGIDLEVLTPTLQQLRKLVREYYKNTGEDIYTAADVDDWKQDIKDIIALEQKKGFRFRQDRSVKNGSSITILMTYGGKRFLFLADSHPIAVKKQLHALGFGKNNPLVVELFQVSHHGSKANMHKHLLEIIKTDNYVFSTNSVRHGHPHKATIARVVSENPKANLFFNYDKVKSGILTPQDRKDFPNVEPKLITEYVVNL